MASQVLPQYGIIFFALFNNCAHVSNPILAKSKVALIVYFIDKAISQCIKLMRIEYCAISDMLTLNQCTSLE